MMREVAPSAVVFYTANLVIVSGYLFAAVLITRRYAFTRGLSVRAWAAGLAFFTLCGMTHFEMAWHSYRGESTIDVDGSVDLHMNLIHIPQAFAIWIFLLAVRPGFKEPAGGPFLRVRCWWWRLGVPSHQEPLAPLEGAAASEGLDEQ